MTRLITTISFLLLFFKITAQTFEGKIIYWVEYKNNTTHKIDSSGLLNYGNKEVFYIKNGDYLIKGNGYKVEWILYKSSTNKIYTKYKNNDTLRVVDAAANDNAINKSFHYKKIGTSSITDSLGKTTFKMKNDEYVFETNNGDEYFYYNSKYKIDGKLFINHKYEHFGDFVSLSNCIPLTRIYNVGEYNCYKTILDIKLEKLDDSIFEIPSKFAQKIKQ